MNSCSSRPAIGPWAFIVARCHYRGSGKGLHTRQYRNDGQQHKQIKGDNRARAGQGQHGQRVQGGLRDPRPGDGGTIPGDPVRGGISARGSNGYL